MKSSLLLLFALVLGNSCAHDGDKIPKTPEEIKIYEDLQAAAYLCAPTIAKYTAERQRAFAQSVLGNVHSLAADALFTDQYSDIASLPGKQKLLACNTVEETRIRNNTCVLAPEVTMGPYYEQAETTIRSNIAEYELGLLFLLNIGVIDVETCEPVPNVLVDIWHANATGYYGGHPHPVPGLENEVPPTTGSRKGMLTPFPKTVWGETFLRGALPTDKNGVAAFTSVFPGYYNGRATHIHVKVHPEWETLPNNTFVSGRLAHIGQLFIEDKLNAQVDKLWPYNLNHHKRTRNWDDGLNIFWDTQIGGYHSVIDTHFLGGVLQQGMIGYVTMTINMSATHDNTWHI